MRFLCVIIIETYVGFTSFNYDKLNGKCIKFMLMHAFFQLLSKQILHCLTFCGFSLVLLQIYEFPGSAINSKICYSLFLLW